MPQILAKLFSLGGNPISDRLYSNLANPGKQERELRQETSNAANRKAMAEREKRAKK